MVQTRQYQRNSIGKKTISFSQPTVSPMSTVGVTSTTIVKLSHHRTRPFITSLYTILTLDKVSKYMNLNKTSG